MGDQQVSPLSRDSKSAFLRHLIQDIEALDRLVAEGKIEQDVTRIGAEQEYCLVNSDLRPSMIGPEVLCETDDQRFTAELAKWNLEINLDPFDVGSGCLSGLRQQLDRLLKVAVKNAQHRDAHVILTGILPTIRKSDLDFGCMTPNPRYQVLDKILREMRGEDFTLNVEGVDEIQLRHSSILFEACNTSFQIHLQIDPREFADRYNWAQVISAPVLSGCVNSPVLLGKELWSETRIALFRQSIDVRNAGMDIRDQQPRVAFGNDFLQGSATEIFKNDVALYYPIVSTEMTEDSSMQIVDRGEIPKLRAMNLHNGTIYKWNRACYGVHNGIPHLRIENRYIPAGPTPEDEIANSAFWVGLMMAMPPNCIGHWKEHFHFPDIRSNFMRAAQFGLAAEFRWFGKNITATRLILEELLPLAEKGLQAIGIPESEYHLPLDVIKRRVTKRQTGSDWIIRSLRSLNVKSTVYESTLMITEAMRKQSIDGPPIDQWEIPGKKTIFDIPGRYSRVDSIMKTDLVTIRNDDSVSYAETVMRWREFHHLPVENEAGELAGVVSMRDIERYRETKEFEPDTQIDEIMTREVASVTPEDSLSEASQLMLSKGIGSLPVVRNRRMIGILTVRDIQRIENLGKGSATPE